jgi:hypothetical protein
MPVVMSYALRLDAVPMMPVVNPVIALLSRGLVPPPPYAGKP